MERKFKVTENDRQYAADVQNYLFTDTARYLAERMYEPGETWMRLDWCKEAAQLVRAAITELRIAEARARRFAGELEDANPYLADEWNLEAEIAEDAWRHLNKRFARLLRAFK